MVSPLVLPIYETEFENAFSFLRMFVNLKEIYKSVAPGVSVSSHWKKFTTILEFLSGPGVIKRQQGFIQSVPINIFFIPAGIKVTWYVLRRDKAAVNINSLTPC
jgi:hypothetical protein